jgi:hypothetical protein
MMRQLKRFVDEIRIVASLVGISEACRWAFAAVTSAPIVLRTGSLGVADRAMGSAFCVRVDQAKCCFHPGDFGVCREIIGHDCYRLRPLRGQIRTAIDLGCNCGTFTLMAVTLNPGCRVVAVDANPEFTAATIANAEANRFGSQVEALTCIVGCPGVESIRQLEADGAAGVFDPSGVIAALGGCDFLKCDVEGGEHALFSGDLSWLRGIKHLAIEYHWTEADGDRLEAVLREEGFVVERQAHRNLGYLFGSRPA